MTTASPRRNRWAAPALALAALVAVATPVAGQTAAPGASPAVAVGVATDRHDDAGPGELPVPTVDADEANEAADDVLRRPEFREEEESLLQRARRWVFDRLGRAIDALFDSGGGTILGWLLVAAALGVAVVFAVRFSRGVQRDPGATTRTAAPARRTATDWRADAELHEAAGDWRAALRCRYRALVADLAGRGVVEEVPGRTAGEYRSELGARLPDAAAEFAEATALFERAWYGGVPTGPDDNRHFRQLADDVLAGAGR